MKNLAITIFALSLLVACHKTSDKATIMIENLTADTLKAEIYDNWSGKTDTILTLAPGLKEFKTDTFDLKSIYIEKYPEQTIFNWGKARIEIQDASLKTDSLNKAINDHHLWTGQVATGQTGRLFIWPESINQNRYIQSWQKFDKILFQLFKDTTYQLGRGSLNDYRFEQYPAAFMLMHRFTDTTGIWITQHVEHVIKKIAHAGVTEKVKQKFLTNYFLPDNNNLRNDSVLNMLSEAAPKVHRELSHQYEQLKQKAKIKRGDAFPSIRGTTLDGNQKKLTFQSKYTLIDFWATWCIPCVKQMPKLNQYARKKPGTLRIVSISVDKEKDLQKWQQIARQNADIHHLWLSDTTDTRQKLGIKGLPHMILVDSAGRIIDPDFPHLANPIAKRWIQAFLKDNQATRASLSQ